MSYIEWLHRGKVERETVGGKAMSLSALLGGGFPVPLGFAVTADGYRRFEDTAGLQADLDRLLATTDLKDSAAVRALAVTLQARVDETPLPDDLKAEIVESYDSLCSMGGTACAVRSSALSEDGAGASFAGLYESYLNVHGAADVLDSVKLCYRSLWSDRAIRYRSLKASNSGEAMAVVVMGLVASETSGIAFTAHPVTGALDQVVINASWGLGEAIVSGRVTPDSFVVEKQSLKLLEREIYEKEMAIFPHPDGGGTIERELAPDRASAPSLSDDQAVAVARIAGAVERHFGCPQDLEWGMAGGQIFLLQSRPITTLK